MFLLFVFLIFCLLVALYKIVDNSTIAANNTVNIVTTRVTNMADLFKSTSFNSDIGHWDTSTVTVTHGMFEQNILQVGLCSAACHRNAVGGCRLLQ